ncbi:MAG: AMP-binding protein [Deltaproteobacteria bacterium]|nr:AMP-binding protein [Deltaproteobacteria bacterium]
MNIDKQKLKQGIQKLRLLRNTIVWLSKFLWEEKKRGTLLTNLKGLPKGEVIEDMSWAELLEERASQVPYKKFLLYKDEEFTYSKMDENVNKIANFLLQLGGSKAKGIGIFMRNSPRFLDIFFGAQKIGMYTVPINAALKGDGLKFIINHSDIEYLAIDAELLESFTKISNQTDRLKNVIVDDIEEEAKAYTIPEGMTLLSDAYGHDISSRNPGIGYNKEDICLIMYTSGTTGLPKGVVYKYNKTNVKKLCVMAGITLKKDDVYYTPLSLFHGNAMFLTVTLAMGLKATVALSRRFSASRFWDEVRRYNATVFNTIGSMIPILMKQPEKPTDNQNKVRYILSAACPADMWEAFERRFGVKIYEGYAAVDGGGKAIMNFGTGPVGSIGRPSSQMGELRIVDENGGDVPVGVPGELIFKVGEAKSSVEYYKNEKATNDKVRDGWLYTGDLVRTDEDGYLYFVGRNTESMRRGGENVSAYEVEHVIMKHPAIEDVAVYAVPSELAEDEIMTSVKLVEGKELAPKELIEFLQDKLAKFAIPRYIRIVDEFPMTSTHRIIKKELEKIGVTKDTYDAKGA